MGIVEPINQTQVHFCAICGGSGGTNHHLIPKSVRHLYKITPPTQFMKCCRGCHDDIHYYLSHWELAFIFNTEAKLKAELLRRKTICFPELRVNASRVAVKKKKTIGQILKKSPSWPDGGRV